METELNYKAIDAGMTLLGNATHYSRSWYIFTKYRDTHESRSYPNELRKLSLEQTLALARDEDGIIFSNSREPLAKIYNVAFGVDGVHVFSECIPFEEFIQKGRPLSFTVKREFTFYPTNHSLVH